MNLLELNFSTTNKDLKDQLSQDKIKAMSRLKRKAQKKEKMATIDNMLRENANQAQEFKPCNPEIKS